MDDREKRTFGELLRYFRRRKNLNQLGLAHKLGKQTRSSVDAWERGLYLPDTPETVLAIADALLLSEQETDEFLLAARYAPKYGKGGSIGSAIPSNTRQELALPSWHVPYHRNPFFTGREEILLYLHDTLSPGKIVALTQPQAISGLGGIGKTQTAVEYAYRHRQDYQVVFWIKADARETLLSDFVNIAHILDLPGRDEQDQNSVADAVRCWLKSSRGWLLVLDNIEDLQLVEEFVPPGYQGQVLLTTRAQVTEPIAQAYELGRMTEQEAILFLLRRTKILALDSSLDQASKSDYAIAREIWKAMDGLPLALDQAGAYILETGCGIPNYLDLYQLEV